MTIWDHKNKKDLEIYPIKKIFIDSNVHITGPSI